jgi:hypothetical protein
MGFTIVQIDESGARTEVASDLAWKEALLLAMQFCVKDRMRRYEIIDAQGGVMFESFLRSTRLGTPKRGIKIYRKPRHEILPN